ncbi:hypothetical protein [Marinicellulosiphila megalodicopiae]|uniref:hypothetical protein n=1 Tax=Marinicellulosiphila megalodicopiae TaxID=2724896 RepID=UPI003BB0A6FE
MAIIFDLQIQFLNKNANYHDLYNTLNSKVTPFEGIDFHKVNNTFITADGPVNSQVSICPENVGLAVSFDDLSKGRVKLSEEKMLELSLHMYDFIKDVPEVDLAIVGWEIGSLDVSYLTFDKNEKVVEVAEVEGLVVSNHLFEHAFKSSEWEEFDATHSWIRCESMPAFD